MVRIEKVRNKQEEVLYCSDGTIRDEYDAIFVNDNARVLVIRWKLGNSIPISVEVDGAEYPSTRDDVLLRMQHSEERPHPPYPVLIAEKWAIESTISSGGDQYLTNFTAGVSMEEFINVIQGKISLSELMIRKISEARQNKLEETLRRLKTDMRSVLISILEVNSKGGPGSRKAVREIIEVALNCLK